MKQYVIYARKSSESEERQALSIPSQIEELEKLAAWFNERGVAANVGAYSEREFYLDAPAAFVDFVIEAMGPELAEYDVQL